MKKAILPAMIAALLGTSVQAATVYDADGTTADVYGRMEFNIGDYGTGGTDGVGSARMGFKGKSAISSDVNAIAKGEWQITSETSNNGTFDARELYAGFDSAEMGSLVFGQTYTAFYQTTFVTDYYYSWGFNPLYGSIDPYRQEGLVVYSGEFSGVSVDASYQFQKEDYTVDSVDPTNNTDLDDGYALSLGYKIADVKVSGAYLLEQFAVAEDKHNFALSAAYTLDDLYLAAVYAESKQNGAGSDADTDLRAYDLFASYYIGEIQVYGGYGFQENTVTNEDTVEQASLGTKYAFNDNLKTWIEYEKNMLSGTDDRVEIALQYNF